MPSPPDVERLLRSAGLRVTAPRRAVLAAVHRHPHADTDAVLRAARSDAGPVSHQAVYDVLRALTETGLVRRIQPAGSVARYEARVADNHHHLVCRSCGVVVDVDCAAGETPCLTASDAAGFEVDEAEVVYWGRCAACAAAAGPPADLHRAEPVTAAPVPAAPVPAGPAPAAPVPATPVPPAEMRGTP